MRASLGWWLAAVSVAAMLLGAGRFGTEAANIWKEQFVPPYIECSLPLCDAVCEQLEAASQICPRAASTNFKVYGEIPGPDACRTQVLNWPGTPQPSVDDPDGCGPCLLKDEKSVCNQRSGGRGFNAGGPPARRGHTMVRYQTPVRSSKYLGAVVLILFGGVDRNDKFLNDVWFYCVDKCPPVTLAKRTYDSFGVAIDYQVCLNCQWEEKNVQQDFIDWISLDHKEKKPSSILRRGIVPARPAGRSGHSSVINRVKSPDGIGDLDIMAVYGGLSPNCTDFCPDYWFYDIMENWWVILYGEWWGVVREWQRMWDYAQFGKSSPVKRWGHAAVLVGDHMFIIGGHTSGSVTACCGYDYNVCGVTNLLQRLTPAADCPYLYDTWVTNTYEYIPFETLLSQGKHATQSSTLGTGVARLAVDGNKDGNYRDTWDNSVTLTNSDSQAWWQIDLGGPQFVANVSIYNRVDRFSERLQNFYVLFSIEPFVSDQLADLLKDPLVYKTHFMYIDEVASMFINRIARYVRVQLAGTNYLSLAEVEVWGYPPVDDWQHLEGMKRWTQMGVAGDYPFGRVGHSATMISDKTVLLYGGFVKEDPYFLNDFWTAVLPSGGLPSFENPLQWQFIEPQLRQPMRTSPVSRYAHSASYSTVCSQGFDVEALAVARDTISPDNAQGSEIPAFVYPGVFGLTKWCRGQVIFYGGSSSAERDPNHPAYPSGYLDDMWIYNVSAETISEVIYAKSSPFPVARREHSAAIDRDFLYVFGGASDQCEGSVCGDLWVYNVSGPDSCPGQCSGHGVCEWGFCVCQPGFAGVDCGGLGCPQSTCTYSYPNHFYDCTDCNGRGICTQNGTCICEVGWKGEACEVIFCPGNCSGHGSCRLGGQCVCDLGFTGADCFEAECPNNCTLWTNGYDSGYRGDCVITRVPACCGEEPNCTRTPASRTPCTDRTIDYVPPHTISAVCQCADSYTGVDCGSEEADQIIAEQNAATAGDTGQGCFASGSSVLRRGRGPDGDMWEQVPLWSIRPGDSIAGLPTTGARGLGEGQVSLARVVFTHEHEEAAQTIRVELGGGEAEVELTAAHAVQLAGTCDGRGVCERGPVVTAAEVREGDELLVLASWGGGGGGVQGDVLTASKVTKLRAGRSFVRYIVTDSDSLIVAGVASLPYSTRAGRVETLPFIALDWLWPGVFGHPAVASALAYVLESPALRSFEAVVNALLAPARRGAGVGVQRGVGGVPRCQATGL